MFHSGLASPSTGCKSSKPFPIALSLALSSLALFLQRSLLGTGGLREEEEESFLLCRCCNGRKRWRRIKKMRWTYDEDQVSCCGLLRTLFSVYTRRVGKKTLRERSILCRGRCERWNSEQGVRIEFLDHGPHRDNPNRQNKSDLLSSRSIGQWILLFFFFLF